jgi:hypothetical protein
MASRFVWWPRGRRNPPVPEGRHGTRSLLHRHAIISSPIQDSDAKLVRIAKDQIEDRKRSEVSLMPNGLAAGLSPRDFADLIAFLQTLKSVK